MRWWSTWLCWLVPAVALADGDLGASDRAARLYRDPLRLDGHGNPLLPLNVASRVDAIEVTAAGGVRVLGTGDGAVEWRVGGPVEIVPGGGKPGEYQHYVVLARAPAWDFDSLRRLKSEWKSRGLSVTTVSSGTTYSLAGRSFDTRVTLLCLEQPFSSAEAAQRRAAELERQTGQDLDVHALVAKPPNSTLVARAGGNELRTADVVWVESATRAPLHVLVGKRDLELPGRIYVVPGSRGGLDVVNEAELERILEGVVASEIFSSAPDAALRAQAIAARTDMLAKVGTRHTTDAFAICSDVHCQAYAGMGRVNPRVSQAVRDTRGVVMVDVEGRLVDAFYHAASGGHTEHNENAWPGRAQPALRGRADLVAGASDPLAQGATEEAVAALLASKPVSWASASGLNAEAERWTFERTAQELLGSLRSVGVAQPVAAMRVLKRGVSGRVTELELALADGQKTLLQGELRIRKALGGSAGAKGMRSSLFLVTPGPGKNGVPQSWSFRGAGFGHGVGMDQTGAVGRARAGQDERAILRHYYNEPKLEKLY
jgi:SpoIID/LytB domain protein